MKARLLALVAAAALSAAAPAMPVQAQPRAAASSLSAADRALLDKAGADLQGLDGARGRFVQTDAGGKVTQGTYYLQRPGKIRFEYDKPSGLLVVADGTNVKVSDRRLKTFDQYPQGQTPLSLFLAKTIDLSKGGVTGVTPRTGGFDVTARDPRKRTPGTITLRFSDGPVALREWTVTDAQGRRTRVQLTSLSRGAQDAKLFNLPNPNRRPGVGR